MNEQPTTMAQERIHVLSASMADQIAAGEVVERSASVVKELVENAIDAGATRVDVELRGGGLESIRVVDDGRGIHPEDMALSIMRHATSKVSTASDLHEIRTLGFRGEALASMAAVATVRLRSRPKGAAAGGTELVSRPGLPPEITPIGMPVGTQVEVVGLFGNVPARRAFVRSEATEVGHCSETLLRLGLVQPDVGLRLCHGPRELVHLPATTVAGRVQQVLARRGPGPYRAVAGEHAGVAVAAWVAGDTVRHRRGLFVVVRRRVVRERSLARIITDFAVPAGSGATPVACLFVDPPAGTVDVNVHPQKAEIRLQDPQTVYAAVRAVLQPLGASSSPPDAGSSPTREGAVTEAVQQWHEQRARDGDHGPRYTLHTRATGPDAATHRQQALRAVADLRSADAETGDADEPAPDEAYRLLGTLPGPVGLWSDGARLWAIDLRRLRDHLVYTRLRRELGGGTIAAQGLLSPQVIPMCAADVALCERGKDELHGLGLAVEAFADDAVVVRAVPAHLRHIVEQADVADLMDRVLPWLRLRGDRIGGTDDLLRAVAQTRGEDPAPRLAKRWLRELVDAGVELESLDGVRSWSPDRLCGDEES